MDTKGEGEEITYPHICFMVDNFDEVRKDLIEIWDTDAWRCEESIPGGVWLGYRFSKTEGVFIY